MMALPPSVSVGGQGTDRPTVLLVDPFSLSRSCTLAGLLPTMASATAVSALSEVPEDIRPDIIIFQDFRSMSGAPSLAENMKAVADRWPECATVVMAEDGDTYQISDSLRGGAHAFLTSNVSLELLLDTLRMVWSGLLIYPREALDMLRDAVSTAEGPRRRQSALSDLDFNRGRFNHLTQRQQDVLRLLSLGLSNKAIALQLNISESTVKVHIRAIMEQAGVNNRTQIIAHFMARGGVIDLPRRARF